MRRAFAGLALRHGRGRRGRGAARLGLAEKLERRLAPLRSGGAVIAGAFAWTWPHCLGRLEQSSPELERLWLSKVREAMPIWRHGLGRDGGHPHLPIAGLVGGLRCSTSPTGRGSREAFIRWAAITLLTAMATALLFWQTRAGPAAQLFGATGAAAFAWIVLSWLMSRKNMVLRIGGIALILMLVVSLARGWFFFGSAQPLTEYRRAINIATAAARACGRWGPSRASRAAW